MGNGFFKHPHPGHFNKEEQRWYCSCLNGPQPAIKLQVKKEGPNKGRYFYTCREPKDPGAIPGQCGFWLWEDRAKEREKEAESRPVQRRSNCMPDLRQRIPRLPWFPPYGEGWGFVDDPYYDNWENPAASADDRSSVKVKEEDTDDQAGGLSAMRSPGRKRPAAAATIVEEDYGDFEPDLERQLVQIVDSSPLRPSQQLRRAGDAPVPAPVLSQVRTGNATMTAVQQPGTHTPSPQRTYDVSASMLTPTSRGNSSSAAAEPGPTKRIKFDARQPATTTRASTSSTTSSQTLPRSLQTTPTANRLSTTTGPGPGDDYQITTEILGILSNERQVSNATRQVIRDKLNTYALRMRGVERGRDMTRAALKAKEANEAELRARIEELERERKVANDKIRALRDGLGELLVDDVDSGVDANRGERS
ncbi:hypothetical protein B0T20DRAFT_413862 [Sordaria brevicollis]|uniref:GRF-type domain-containing protein n=1 Tax=Sordaria brevicollis TaxID=83679 RepID=A0AAE0PDJ9_SORBR|nr:hypothetical protein B0T20DRAFT_413862 [Sordaria brevicollis]